MTPAEADHWFEEHLPGREGWLRFDLIRAAVERVSDFEVLLPAALAVVPMGGAVTAGRDLQPLLNAAFPHPYRDGDQLSSAQRAYLAALVDRDALWNRHALNVAKWFRKAELPHDREACRAITAGRNPY